MYAPGFMLLWVAFLLGVLSTVGFALAGERREHWLRLARQSYVLMTAAIVVASALLMFLLVRHDYRLFYVYSYSDNSLAAALPDLQLLGRPGGQLPALDLLRACCSAFP